MDVNFETELDALRQKILLLAGHAEKAVHQAVQSLVQRDGELAGLTKYLINWQWKLMK
jgi:hypothetical protein